MKTFKIPLISLTLILIGAVTFAQAPPQAFTYSAIAKGSGGQMLVNKTIGLQFSILEGSSTGTVVYQESQTANTDPKGIFVTAIGTGTPIIGTLAGVNWGGNIFFLQVELDENGGTSYVNVGTTQLLSVPYALYAATSGTSDSGLVGATGPTGAAGPTGPPGVSSSASDPLHPDGLDSISSVNTTVTSGSPYTVPAGKNFYGSFHNMLQNTNTINVGGNLLYSWAGISAILGSGTTISHSGTDNIAVNGYTVAADVTPVIINNTALPYTVPVGQILYITAVYQQFPFVTAITFDGMQPYTCFPPSCSPSPDFYVLNAGMIIGGSMGAQDLLVGYLK